MFGEEFDISLGYILKVKCKHREKAIDFIKELPEELVNNIREVYSEGLDSNHGIFDMTNSEKRPRSFFEVYSKENKDICYKFYIMCKELFIVKSRIVNEAKVDLFSLTIKANDPNNIKNMNDDSELYLGTISKGEYNKFNFTEMEYDLKKTKSGYQIKRTCQVLSSSVKMKTKKLDDSNIQEEIHDSQRLVFRLRK